MTARRTFALAALFAVATAIGVAVGAGVAHLALRIASRKDRR